MIDHFDCVGERCTMIDSGPRLWQIVMLALAGAVLAWVFTEFVR